jgi:hypothetical protein
MSDFESRLRDTLEERAAAAPGATGLADGARRRLRRRRTTWTVASAAAVAAAVPLGLSLWGGDGGPGAVDPTVASDVPVAVEPGFRVETWRDLTFEVPAEWRHGGTTAWCTQPGPVEESRPVVTRPDVVVPMIACTPGSGYGATISPPTTMISPAYDSGHVWRYDTEGVDEAAYPDGAWLGYWYDGTDVVTVATPERELTRRIVDSVRRYEGADPNGCPPDLSEAEATTSSVRDLTLCRYDGQDLLSASGSWSGEEADVRLEALSDGAALPESGGCTDQEPTGRIAVLGSEGYLASAVVEGCAERHGIYFSGSARRITPAARDVLSSIG